MSYKFDSLIMILNKIDSKELVTVYSLMDELEISERTVHRYIQTLQVAGFPILYDRKKETYTFSDDYSLKKPNLSVEEQLAFSLAKNFLGAFGESMQRSLDSIETKLTTKKSGSSRSIILSAERPSPLVENHFAAIHQAITDYKKIELDYSALHSGEFTRRKISPYYIFFNEGFWYVRGHCHRNNAMRIFALDRIQSLKVLDEHFLPKGPLPEDELSESFGTWIDGDPEEVVLIFDQKVKSQVLRKKWHKSQKEKELKDGRIQITFTIKGLGGIKKWIYSWIPYVEVVEPKELREEMKYELKKALNKNQ